MLQRREQGRLVTQMRWVHELWRNYFPLIFASILPQLSYFWSAAMTDMKLEGNEGAVNILSSYVMFRKFYPSFLLFHWGLVWLSKHKSHWGISYLFIYQLLLLSSLRYQWGVVAVVGESLAWMWWKVWRAFFVACTRWYHLFASETENPGFQLLQKHQLRGIDSINWINSFNATER